MQMSSQAVRNPYIGIRRETQISIPSGNQSWLLYSLLCKMHQAKLCVGVCMFLWVL